MAYILLSGYRPFVAVEFPGELKNAGKAAMVTSILMGRYHFDHPPFKKVSAQGIRFVQNMLCPNYLRRWHAVDALASPWLSNDSLQQNLSTVQLQNTELSTAVSNIRKKANASSLHNTSMVAIAFSRSQNDATHLRALFQSFDTENCGFLSKDSFRKAMLSVSPDLSNYDVDVLFEAIDVDNDKQISFTEFLAATMDPRDINMDDMSKAFRLLDADDKGYLTQDDFCRVLAVDPNSGSRRMKLLRKNLSQRNIRPSSSHGSGYGSDDLSKSYATGMADDDAFGMYGPGQEDEYKSMLVKIQSMVESADVDKDGVVSYSEFLMAMGNFEGVENSGNKAFVISDLTEKMPTADTSTSSNPVELSTTIERENSGGNLHTTQATPSRPKSLPFLQDPNDVLPLSPINESPNRIKKFFGGKDAPPNCSSPKEKLVMGSPKKGSIYCSDNTANASPVPDDLSCEELDQTVVIREKPTVVPHILVSVCNKLSTGTFLASPAHCDPDSADKVFDFEPAPMLKNSKRWASEGNILKNKAGNLLNENDEDEIGGRVVNGSPDVERAQKKIEYIVEAVNEVGHSTFLQTPRLALSRQNSRIDPKALDNSMPGSARSLSRSNSIRKMEARSMLEST